MSSEVKVPTLGESVSEATVAPLIVTVPAGAVGSPA